MLCFGNQLHVMAVLDSFFSDLVCGEIIEVSHKCVSLGEKILGPIRESGEVVITP
jgi:hypothetical protein